MGDGLDGPELRRFAGAFAQLMDEVHRLAQRDGDSAAPAELLVQDRHLDAALAELADEGSRLTRALLGGDPTAQAQPAAPGPGYGGRRHMPLAYPSVWPSGIIGRP